MIEAARTLELLKTPDPKSAEWLHGAVERWMGNHPVSK